MIKRISIALATFNGEKYLKEQLDSFVAQTRLPDELVICDDGSTDATIRIIDEFALTAPFETRIFQNSQNLGYVRNFEKVISLCSGDIIFLSDQDDVWLPEKLGIIYERFVRDQKTKIVACDMFLTDEGLNLTGRRLLANSLKVHRDLRSFVYGCGTALSKDFFQILTPFPTVEFSHDGWIHNVAVALDVRETDISAHQLYRRHLQNASNTLASRTRILSDFEVLLEDGLKDVSEGWKKEIERVEITLDRLNEREDLIEKFGMIDALHRARFELRREIINRNRRIAIVDRPRFLRPLAIFRLWVSGGYRYFSGWKSMAKDLIRP